MSDKPVSERLQVKGTRRLAVVGAPAALDPVIGALDRRAPVAAAEVVLLMAPDRATLDRLLGEHAATLAPGAILWLAYPKLTSPLAGDLSRERIWEVAGAHGLDTVSQIAIDQDWTAMRVKRVGVG